MALNIRNKVFEFLRKNENQRFTARDIAEWVFESYPKECEKKKARSTAAKFPIETDADLIQQIAAEISSVRPDLQRKFPLIKTTEERPKRYYLTTKSDSDEIEIAESAEVEENGFNLNKIKVTEHSLYPKVSEYLFTQLNIYSKRVDEKKSKNNKGSGGNKWLFPDIVGMEDLTKDWQRETKECVKEMQALKAKLWSFEVKILINRSNVREVFFQTVSNSTWANYAYLVAAEIVDDRTTKELRILSGLHGIGVIQLNIENPSESLILMPAKERSEVDWNTIDRLVEENADFVDYIRLVKQFYQTGDPRTKDWD
jgi:hypothetical protein